MKEFDYIQSVGSEIRNNIIYLLELFERYNIPATWAIVGHLFLDSCSKKDCITFKNINHYNYKKNWYKDPYTNQKNHPLYYGKDLVEKIINNQVDHEIAYHSFSHPIFNDISKEMAKNEVFAAKKIEKEYDIKFSSFVFPADKVYYTDLLIEYGFKVFRGELQRKYNINKSSLKDKIFNYPYKLFPPPVYPTKDNDIWEIKTSMFYGPEDKIYTLLPRAKFGLSSAIKKGKIFHLYLHPWNLSRNKYIIKSLDKLFNHLTILRDKNKIKILRMCDIPNYF